MSMLTPVSTKDDARFPDQEAGTFIAFIDTHILIVKACYYKSTIKEHI
jgi:hypothetical protein